MGSAVEKIFGKDLALPKDTWSAFEDALTRQKPLPKSNYDRDYSIIKDKLGFHSKEKGSSNAADDIENMVGKDKKEDDKKTDNNKKTDESKNDKTIEFPDFMGMSGEDITKFLKDNDLIRFEGPLADKMERVFIKNINSSEFFKKAVIHGFETEGKKMTFGSDPKDKLEGAAAYATSRDGRNFIWVGGDRLVRQDLIAHEFFHAALGTDDGGTKDDLGDYGKVPGSNQIAEAVFAEEAGIEHGGFDLYKNGEITQASDLNVDFDKFMENKDNEAEYGKDGSKDYDYKKLIQDSGDYKALNTDKDYDDRLNQLTEGIRSNTDPEKRTTKHLVDGSGKATELGEQFKDLVYYHLSKNPDMSVDEAGIKAYKDLSDRLGNFKKEANVFNGYLERHDGGKHLKQLAEEAYNEFNYNELNQEQWK